MQLKIETPAESMFHILGTPFPNDWTMTQRNDIHFQYYNQTTCKYEQCLSIADGQELYCRGLFLTPVNYVIPYYDDFEIVNFRPVYSTGFHLVKRKGNDAIVELIFANGWTEKVVEITIPNMFLNHFSLL